MALDAIYSIVAINRNFFNESNRKNQSRPKKLHGASTEQQADAIEEDEFVDTLFDLSHSCPELYSQLNSTLEESGNTIISGDRLITGFTLSQLISFENLLRQSIKPATTNPELTFQNSSFILEDLKRPPEIEQTTTMDKLTAWLLSLFESSDKKDWEKISDWFSQFTVPPWLGKAFLYSTIGLTLALTFFVIGRELRSAGLFTRGKKLSNNPLNLVIPFQDTTPQTWQELDSLPAKEYSIILLKLVIQTLTNEKLIPDDGSLTNREIFKKVKSIDPIKAKHFDILSRTLEPVVYGKTGIEQAILIKLTKASRNIFDSNSIISYSHSKSNSSTQ